MRKKSRNGMYALIALIVIVLGAYGYQQGYFTAPPARVAPGGTTTTPSGGVYTGPLTVNIANFDSLDPTTARTEGTNVKTTWWEYRGGVYLARASGTAQTFDLTAADGGWIYASSAVYATNQAFYLDFQKTKDANSRIKDYSAFDINGDGKKEQIFKIWVGDLQPPTAGQTAASFYLNEYWYSYAVLSLNVPGDITSIGTTAGTTEFIEWKNTFAATKEAAALTAVQIKFNSTLTTKWTATDSYLDINNGLRIYLSDMTKTTDGTNTYYDYEIGNRDFSTAYFITYPSSAVNNFPMNFKIVCNFGSSEKYGITLTEYWIDSNGVEQSDYDLVGLAA